MERALNPSRWLRSLSRHDLCNSCVRASRRAASTTTTTTTSSSQSTTPTSSNDSDLTESSSFDVPAPGLDDAATFDPLKPSRERKYQLPPSKYQYRSPKYDRGPLHPHQPPPNSDPSSRLFVPGPFSSPRLEQAYHNIIAPDFMTLCYQHTPPGFRPLEKGPRLRPWIGDSPYFKNRQLRGPRGGDVLRLLRKPITFRNVPMLERVTVHAYCKGAVREGSPYIHVAGMVLQAITNQRVVTHKARKSESGWSLVKGKTVSMTADLKGEDMYHFLSKLINVVMPRIKDYRGVRATTGDGSGNLSLGLEPEVIGGFPEIEVNYDAYPPKMIPGLYVTIHTTANTDKDARLLLQSIGVPFYGKVKD